MGDGTDDVMAHERLLRQRLEALLVAFEALTGSSTIGELYEELVLLMTSEVFGAEHALVLEGDEQSELLFVVASSTPALKGHTWSRTERLERVLGGQIVALKDASPSEEWGEHLAEIDARAVLHLPVRSTAILVAVHSEVGFFTRDDVLLAGRLVPPVARLIHRLNVQQHHLQQLRAEYESRVMREQLVLIKHAARALGAGVAVLDPRGSLSEASEALTDLLRAWPSPSRWWEDARRVLSETPFSGVEPVDDGLSREEGVSQTKRTIDMSDPDGARRVFELTFTGHAHPIGSGAVGHVILVVDVTRWVLAEEALVLARDEAQRASRAKSQFLANMSHELRTPLNAIVGYSEMVMEDLDDDVPITREDIERVHTSAHQLLSLINDVLDLSKIEAGKLEAHMDWFSLDGLLDEVERTVHPMILDGGNRFVRLEHGLPARLWSDRDKLRQVLLNLLSNAAKFTEQGAITLDVRADAEAIRFEVRDSGIGIPSDRLDRLFTAFEQIDPSTTRRYGGTGLGLAISLRFVHMLRGDIEVESEVGEGSVFRVHLPLEEP